MLEHLVVQRGGEPLEELRVEPMHDHQAREGAAAAKFGMRGESLEVALG